MYELVSLLHPSSNLEDIRWNMHEPFQSKNICYTALWALLNQEGCAWGPWKICKCRLQNFRQILIVLWLQFGWLQRNNILDRTAHVLCLGLGVTLHRCQHPSRVVGELFGCIFNISFGSSEGGNTIRWVFLTHKIASHILTHHHLTRLLPPIGIQDFSSVGITY